MNDEKIVLFVVMCVIFVVGAALLIFLLWKYGRWGKNNKMLATDAYANNTCGIELENATCGTYLEHYENEHQQQEEEEQHRKSNSYVSHDKCSCAREHANQNQKLYFVDFTNHEYNIDLLVNQQIQRGWQLQQRIAQLCNMANPETLALVYRDEKQTVSWLDLDLLIARDANFCKRMHETSLRPLLLARLTEVQIHDMITREVRLPVDNEEMNAIAHEKLNNYSRVNEDNVMIDLHVSKDKQLEKPIINSSKTVFTNVSPSRSEWLSKSFRPEHVLTNNTSENLEQTVNHSRASQTNNMSLCKCYPSNIIYNINNSNSCTSNDVSCGIMSMISVPKPIIFPLEEHITSRTPISITASDYYDASNLRRQRRSGEFCDIDITTFIKKYTEHILATGEPNTVNRVELDSNTLLELESAMSSVNEHRPIHLRHSPLHNTSFTAHPHKGLVRWHFPNHTTRDLVRIKADVLRFAIDGANPDQWSFYSKPFCLPPGKWCIRAKASLFSDENSITNAKVYTVDV